jgi:predicted methyltransferase
VRIITRGSVLAEANETEQILHVDIGERWLSYAPPVIIDPGNRSADPTTFSEARKGIPVSTQRRFDVYVDVATERPKM